MKEFIAEIVRRMVAKEVAKERERIVDLLVDEDLRNAYYWDDAEDGTVEAVVEVLRNHYYKGFYAAIDYLVEVQESCEDPEDYDLLDIPIELLKGEIGYPEETDD